MNYLECTAAIIGFISTYLYVKQHIWAWPTSIIMLALYFIVFSQVHLYADMMSQLVFLILQIYGWYYWLYGGESHSTLKVSRLSLKLGYQLGLIIIAGTSILYYFLHHYTDGQMKFLDASTTIASFIAQWMLARKIIENWLLWLLIDSVYLLMYIHLNLFFTSLLYATLLILAIMGYVTWKQEYETRYLFDPSL